VPQEPQIAIVVALLVSAYFLLASITLLRRTTVQISKSRRPPLRRPIAHFGRNALITQAGCALLLLLLYDEFASWTPESVGLKVQWHWWNAVILGVGCYAIFYIGVTAALWFSGHYDRVADETTRVLVGLWPRRRADRLMAAIAFCLSNPITEELLFRGIVVHQLSIVCESIGIALSVGLLVHMANHAYQGSHAFTTHIPFYAISCGLLFSPAGLWGAIGFHMAGDCVPFVLLKTAVLQYRRRHRRIGLPTATLQS
jgi:membrane protease YdiL (CAAX protease family)